MAYNAGTAFITVAPSFRGFQTKADAEAKKLRAVEIPGTLNLDDGKAREKIAAISRPRTVNLGVNADTGAAKAAIDEAARNRKATVNVNADTGKARSEIAALSGGSVLLKVGLALSPLAGPLTGAALGLGGIAAGVGAGVAGAAAIGTASIKSSLDLQKKLTSASKARVSALAGVKSAEASLASAVASSNTAQIAGTRAIVSAQQSLADARRNAATVAINSARQIKSAEEALDNTERQLKDSLDALHAARLQAKQDLIDLKDATQHDALNTEGAQIALVQAQQNLVQVQSTALPGSLALREAELQYKEAALGVSDAKRQQLDDTKALNKATKEGISGAPGVKSAQEQVAQARQAVADARTQLQQAKADGARAKADAARSVARARTALSQAEADAARNVAAAKAREAVARERVAAAQGKLNKADAASAALMARMTPMQVKLLAGIKALKKEWHTFLDSTVAGPVDSAALAGMGAIRKGLPALGNFITPVAHATGSVLTQVGNAASSRGARAFASDFGQFSGSLLKDAGRGSINLGHALGNILKAFMPLSRAMSKGLVGMTRDFAKWSDGLGKSKGFKAFLGIVKQDGPILLQVLKNLIPLLGNTMVAVGPLANLEAQGLEVFTGMLNQLLSSLSPQMLHAIALGIAAVVIGMKAWAIWGVVIEKVTAGWAKVQALLNGELFANPIGLVVLAVAALAVAFVIAYKKSDTFRAIVNKVWKDIQIGAQYMWYKVIHPIFTAWVWTLQHYLFPVLKFLWTNVVKPYYTLVFKLIAWAWKNVIQPTFKALGAFLTNVLFPVIKQLWDNVVKPVFNRVWTAIKVAWVIIRAIFQIWRAYMVGILFPIIRLFYDAVVKPVMNKVGGSIHDTWVNIIKPVFTALKNFITDTLVPAFRNGIEAIGAIWATLEDLTRKPVQFVIDTVWNNGLRKVINSIPSVTDLPVIHFGGSGSGSGSGKSSSPHGGHQAGKGLAQGGVLPGFTPGRDVHHFVSPTAGSLHLSGGEAIMRPEFTAMVGGERGVAALNKRARALRARGIHHFSGGGIFRPTAGGSPHSLQVEGGFNATDISPLPDGSAVHAVKSGVVATSADLKGYEPRLAALGIPQNGYKSYGRYIVLDHGAFRSIYAHLSQRLAGVGQHVAGGNVIGRSGHTGWATGPHLHFGVAPGSPFTYTSATSNYGSAGSVVVGGAGSGSGYSLPNPLRFIHLDAWKNSLGKMGAWGHMMGQMVGSIVPDVVSWVKDHVGSFVSGATGQSGGTVHQIVQGLASRSGWGSGAEWAALVNLINSEDATWSPTAQNPHSSAYGLFQFLDGTWATVGGHKTSDPYLQTEYGLKYIANRYHDPIGAWNFHKSHGTYDDGGYIPAGVSTIYNGTGKPEPVLTSAQWADIRKAGGAGGSAPSQAGVHMEHVHVTNVDELIRKQKAAQHRALTMARLA